MPRQSERDVVVVTTAQPSRLDEFERRKRRYLITMTIRLVAFIVAVVIYETVGGPMGLVAAALATVLPWIAVVAANAAPKRVNDQPSLYVERMPVLERPEDRERRTG